MRILEVHPVDPMQIHRARTAKPQHTQIPDPRNCERKVNIYSCTSCEELTHWKRLWCWEGLGAGGEGNDRGWDGWMASPTRWTWVWVNSRIWWWTGRAGVLRFMESQRVGHDWATELNGHRFRVWPRDLLCPQDHEEWNDCFFKHLCLGFLL